VSDFLVGNGPDINSSGSITGTVSLTAGEIQQFVADIGVSAGAVTGITLNLTNVSVEELAFDQLSTIRNNLGPICSSTLDDFRGEGVAYQVQQALKADVTYTLSFSSNVDAGAQLSILEKFSGRVAANAVNTSNSTVSGVGLYYGISKIDIR
jgi:hypothetical protein